MRHLIYGILLISSSTWLAAAESSPLSQIRNCKGGIGYIQVSGSPETAGVGFGGISYVGPHGIDGSLNATTVPFKGVLYSMWSADLCYLHFLSQTPDSGFWGLGVGLFDLYISDTYHAAWSEPALHLFRWCTLQACSWPERVSRTSCKLLPTLGYIWGRNSPLVTQLQLQLDIFYVHRLANWRLGGWGCAPQISLAFGLTGK